MQPGSMIGAQVNSVTACLSTPQQQELNSPPEHNIPSRSDQANHYQPHHGMDDFLEQILSIPSWADVGGGKAPWEYNANAELSQNNPKYFTMSLMPPGIDPLADQDLNSTTREVLRDGENQLQYSFDDSFLGSRLPHQQKENLMGPQESPQTMFQLSTGNANAPQLLATIGNSTRSPVVLTRSPSSAGSSGSEGSATHQASTDNIPSPTQTWRAPYVGGMLPLPLSLGQAMKTDHLQRMNTSGNEDQFLGKRLRDIDEDIRAANSGREMGHPGGLFTTLADHQAQAVIRPNNQRSLIPQSGQGVPFQTYGAHPQHHHPPVVAAPSPAPARPRVRARRGQATDPHSIAERLRRERIAERMKALQELVPNCNKTDKASMLDEIVDYVKFLQLQVKVLSMSRLGGAGAVAPLNVAGDITASSEEATRSNGTQSPSKDGLALTERQVAKLMEEDMGSAMQYLQGKGLCLMPLSLATAMSGTGSRSQANLQNPIGSPPSATAESSIIEGNAATS